MNALANPEVGTYVNENFCSAFQKVGTFRIVGKNKQGGNVATYFCAPDGRVLHTIAGPVDAATFLREAKWVVTTTETSLTVVIVLSFLLGLGIGALLYRRAKG